MIDYLFEETFYFQSILGFDRHEFNEKAGSILLDYLEQYPERQGVYFERTMDFLVDQIAIEETQSGTKEFEEFCIENLIKAKTESAVRFFLDIFLMIYEKFGFIENLYKKFKNIYWNLKNDVGALYKHLLVEEKYQKVAVLFEV